MSNNIRVNFQNPIFIQKTYNKGERGLGNQYTKDSSRPSNEIVFSQTVLNGILFNLRNTISQWSSFSGRDISDYFGGASGGRSLSEDMVSRLKKELNRILFNSTLPNPDTYFPFNDRLAVSKNKSDVMTYMLNILNDYVDITLRVLNRESGLSEQEGTVIVDETTGLSEVSNTSTVVDVRTNIKISKLQIPLLEALITSTEELTTVKSIAFFDESREYKTLLNVGDDRQYVVESWRMSPSNPDSIQLKLFSPIDTTTQLYSDAYVVRELAKSVVDTITFQLGPRTDNTPYLRPYDSNALRYTSNKKSINNVTLNNLGLTTGVTGEISGSVITYEDTVFRRWFTGDFKSSELNIDFTNYNNFVQFSSAYDRLVTFTEKLRKIEELGISTTASAASSNTGAALKAIQREEIIRNFDPYEQFLYYATGSIPYSASAYYVSGEVEYNSTSYWPKKVEGVPYETTSTVALDWLSIQENIAQRYDDNNGNYLIRQLPSFLQEDINSIEFLTFVSMIGHLFDNIKVYIDQFPNIYSKHPDPYQELSMDQVYEVAQSFGIKLPNAYSLENLQTFISSISGESGSRALVTETWKRFLHSAIYLSKAKGTRTAFDGLLNTYGLNSPALQIKETSYPIAGNYLQSDELTYGLKFTSSSVNTIRLPFVSASINAKSLQIRFLPQLRQSSSILSGDQRWAIDIVPHPSSSKLDYGRLHFVSGSNRTVIASSSYFPLFSDDYTNIMFRSQSSQLYIIQTDGDQILYQESASIALTGLWNNTQFAYVGGSGSIRLGNFDGIVDEVRVWGEVISEEDFIAQSYDPGSYYGNNYTSSYVNLYVDIGFSKPLSSITQSVINESPYQFVSTVPTLPATGFTTSSYQRIIRSIKQYTPLVGSTIYTNKKITIAPAPVFEDKFIDENGSPVLNKNESIKATKDKQYIGGQNIVSLAVSPTDYANQNIMRSMGVVDVNNLIGSPRNITATSYTNLNEINKKYLEYYNETVNANEYIRFYRNLVESPSELAETMVPARAKLVDGIVIESPILSRNKTYSLRSIKVDGSNTKEFDEYDAGSGSFDIGAYPLNATYGMTGYLTMSSDYQDLTDTIDVSQYVEMVSSTPPTKLPPARVAIQTLNGTQQVTASVFDNNSSVDYIEATAIEAIPDGALSSPYTRNPYLGITNRLPSEDNTLIPLYDILPRADLNDIGTTSYFHKSDGLYYYKLLTPYKQKFLAKLDTQVDSPIDRLYSKITLLDPNSIAFPPGRDVASISIQTYAPGNYTTGVLNIANIFSIIGVTATEGLRIRLYRSDTDRIADISRDFSTPPTENSGVLFDVILDGTSDVFPYTLIQTTDSVIYYGIENTTSSDITTTLDISYFAYEPPDLLPRGYLPRHYKFSRENVISLKRRNYLGCRDRQGIVNNTFVDGWLTKPDVATFGCPWSPCPPFRTEITEQNEIIVNNPPRTGGNPRTIKVK